MEPHFGLPPSEPGGRTLPSLPIVTPDPPRKSEAEKYGNFYYLGLAGLVVLIGLIGYFAFGIWSLRGVMANVYTLHSNRRSDAERIQAAYALSRDPRVTQREYWEICLRKPLPPLARYLMAEAVSADTVAADPKGYALIVARSEAWPDWLRVQLTRPLAYAAARGDVISAEPLTELSRNADRAVSLWAEFCLAVADPPDRPAAARILLAARTDGPYREFAADLEDALQANDGERVRRLDAATLWLRHNHPDSARVWEGWEVVDGRLLHVR